MTTARTAIQDFSTANKIYVNATVTFYTVNPDTGGKTNTPATLYAGLVGSTMLPNPQTLDSYGKFKQPVYVDQAVIATVTGLGNAPDHDTGIIADADVAGFASEAQLYAIAAQEAAASLNLPNISGQDGRSLVVKSDETGYEMKTLTDTSIVYVRDMNSWHGDGTSDEGPAINEAVASLGTRGGTVVFPSGVITISTPVSDAGKPITFLGRGTGGGSGVAPTVVRPASNTTQCFRTTSYNTIIEGIYFDGSLINGTTPLATLTPSAIGVFVGYSSTALATPSTASNARHNAIRDCVFNYWPGKPVYWAGGSHLEVNRVRCFCCQDAFTVPVGKDNAHGNWQEIQLSYCVPWGIKISSWSHVFKQVKAFNCGNPADHAGGTAGGNVYINGETYTGNLFVEQANSARSTINFVTGQSTFSVDDGFMVTAKVGMTASAGSCLPNNTFISALSVSPGACTVTFSQAAIATVSNQLATCVNMGQSKVPAVFFDSGAHFHDQLYIQGDSVDPRSLLIAKMNASTNVKKNGCISSFDGAGSLIHRSLRTKGFYLEMSEDAGSYDQATECTFQADVTSGSPTLTNVPDWVFDAARKGCDVSAPEISASTSLDLSAVDRDAQTLTMSSNALTTKTGCWVRLRIYPAVGGLRMQSWDDKKFMLTATNSSSPMQLWFGGSGALYKGTIRNGQPTITNIRLCDPDSYYAPLAGMEVYSPLFPSGTTISSVSGTTITCSQNATGTDTNSPVYVNYSGSTVHLGWMNGLRTFNKNQDALNNIHQYGALYQTSDGYVRISNPNNTNSNEGSVVWDPPSIASGTSVNSGTYSADITVTNAAVGDFVQASCSRDLQGLTLTGYVQSSGVVRLVLSNLTGGAVDIASSTFRARICKSG